MLLVYAWDPEANLVAVATIQDARTGSAVSGTRRVRHEDHGDLTPVRSDGPVPVGTWEVSRPG